MEKNWKDREDINMSNAKQNKPYDFSTLPYCESPYAKKNNIHCSKECCLYETCECPDKPAFTTPEDEMMEQLLEMTGDIGGIFFGTPVNRPKKTAIVHVAKSPRVFNINGVIYTMEELQDICKKHEDVEKSKYKKCDKCGKRYMENKAYNLVDEGLDKKDAINESSAKGYASTPYITGIQVLSGAIHGDTLNLCDCCVAELVDWFRKK